MFRISGLLLALSCTCIGQSNCRVYDLRIGDARDGVLSELKHRGCELKIDVPENGLEDDLILSSSDSKYSYYEVIFDKGKLGAVWSYSPYFSSAEKAFSSLLEELMNHSTAANPSNKVSDTLGQRSLAATVFLERPISESFGLGTVGFKVENGTVLLEMKRTKDQTVGVRVATVRNQ